MAYCEGCDSEQPGMQVYRVKFSGNSEWETTRYCRDCYDLAALNWNGETDVISRARGDE